MKTEKFMLCLDEAIIKREDMLNMFRDLSEGNDHIVTDEMIGEYGGKYMLYYSKYISQLNLDDICVEVKPIDKHSFYVKVHYTDIRVRGIYSKFLRMRMEFWSHPEFFTLKRTEIAKKYNISEKAVQVFMGYITSASDNIIIQKAIQKERERRENLLS